ncbi:MAG TPA: DMT family transporter [Gaiellaceae bacterium]|nr:DMT family transporter [Gaiellaceae bacterium]
MLAVVAAICFALAATLWQRASLALGLSPGQPQAFARLLGSRVWLLGLAAQTAGVLLQAAALDRGRVAVIQPLLVTAVVWAMPLGYFLTGQVITRRHVLGAALVVAGLAVFASFGDPAAGVDDAPASDWAMAFLVLGATCVGLLLFSRRGGSDSKAAVFGAVAGILYGISATLMKPVVENLHAEGAVAVLESWELWVMAIGGLVGFYVQQLSLATGKLVTSVATVSVVNPVVSVLLGALVLQERLDRDPRWHAVVAVGALAVALLGAIVAASASEGEKEREAAQPAVAA